MSQPKSYDAITKQLIDLHPTDWLRLIGIPDSDAEPMDVDILDSDISAVSSQADRVLRINGRTPSLLHIEMETGHHGSDSPKRLLRYSVLISGKYNLPVESAIILLRPEADSPALTGFLEYSRRSGIPYLSFAYTVIRAWQIPVDVFLEGGLGTLPLAPLAAGAPDRVQEVLARMGDRFAAEAASAVEEGDLWTTTNILMGLRYSRAQAVELLKGVRQMKESVTYQAILEEGEARGEALGRAKEARGVILRLGRKRFGDPDAETIAVIDAIVSVNRLEQLVDLLLEVETWSELLSDTGII